MEKQGDHFIVGLTRDELTSNGLVADLRPPEWAVIMPNGKGGSMLVAFKNKEDALRNYLAEPQGSILVNRVTMGYFTKEEYAQHQKRIAKDED